MNGKTDGFYEHDPWHPAVRARLVAQAEQQRAEAIAHGIVAVWRGLAALSRVGAQAIARRRRQGDTRLALMACSDRVLEDIGIKREHIPLIARGIDPAQHQPRSVAVRRRLQGWLEAAGARSRERRRVYRELMPTATASWTNWACGAARSRRRSERRVRLIRRVQAREITALLTPVGRG